MIQHNENPKIPQRNLKKINKNSSEYEYLSVQAARTEEGRVQHIRAVGGHDHFHLSPH